MSQFYKNKTDPQVLGVDGRQSEETPPPPPNSCDLHIILTPKNISKRLRKVRTTPTKLPLLPEAPPPPGAQIPLPILPGRNRAFPEGKGAGQRQRAAHVGPIQHGRGRGRGRHGNFGLFMQQQPRRQVQTPGGLAL